MPYIWGLSVHLLAVMNITHAVQILHHWDNQGRVVFTHQDMATLFPQEGLKTLSKSLERLVRSGLLVRACRGVYVNAVATTRDGRLLEHIAVALRRGEYSYVSLESMLSEFGAISQVPMDRITVMTTGRKGEYRTPFGVIEFTHTSRSVTDILAATSKSALRPLRMASPETAWRDLKRVGRNTHMVNTQMISTQEIACAKRV